MYGVRDGGSNGRLAGRCIPDSMFTRPAARNLWKLFAAISISRIHASDLSLSLSPSLHLALLVCLDPEQGDIRPDLVLPLFCPRHVEISIPRRGCYPIKSGRRLFLGDFAPFIPEVILHSRSDRLLSDVSRAWTACFFQDRAIVRGDCSFDDRQAAMTFETVDVGLNCSRWVYNDITNGVALWRGRI